MTSACVRPLITMANRRRHYRLALADVEGELCGVNDDSVFAWRTHMRNTAETMPKRSPESHTGDRSVQLPTYVSVRRRPQTDWLRNPHDVTRLRQLAWGTIVIVVSRDPE